MLAADDIRSRLRAKDALDHFCIKHTQRGQELRTTLCPACGQRNRDAICVNSDTGVWFCNRCAEGGDIFTLIAGFAGLDIKHQFRQVLELGAEIAGLISRVEMEPWNHRGEQYGAERTHGARSEAERHAQAARMTALWQELPRSSSAGERYLAGRGVDPAILCGGADLVRFTKRGEPAVALRELVSGDVVGVQLRRIEPGVEPKVLAMRGSKVAGSCLHGRLSDIDPGGVDVAVLVEGLIDTLVAHAAFQGCAIFGAPGAGQLARIAAAVASRVAECSGWLLIVADDDEAGARGAGAAVVAAEHEGLKLAEEGAGLAGAGTVRLVDLGPHHDLGDAWSAGWRWSWPT